MKELPHLVPHDMAAERCTIGAMIICGADRVTFNKIRRAVWPDAFFESTHGLLYRVLSGMVDAATLMA